MSALKPCPFCGGAPKLAEDDSEGGRSFAFHCGCCSWTGPWGESASEAISLWAISAKGITRAARAQRIRDIVAQQWAVAIALLDVGMPLDPDHATWSNGPNPDDPERGGGWVLNHGSNEVAALAALPSAAEIVGGGE